MSASHEPGILPHYPTPHCGSLRLLAASVVAASSILCAQQGSSGTVQNAQPVTAPTAPAVPAGPSQAGAPAPASGAAPASGTTDLSTNALDASPAPPSAAGPALASTVWNQSLFEAFQPGCSLGRFAEVNPRAGLPDAVSPQPARRAGAAFRASSVHPAPKFTVPTLDQLTRQGMNLRFNSTAGTFRFTYREIFGGRGNSIGGGVGQATAAATYTTSNFRDTLVNLSASTFMGTPTRDMLGTFVNTPMWTGGTAKHPAPTVSLRLTF